MSTPQLTAPAGHGQFGGNRGNRHSTGMAHSVQLFHGGNGIFLLAAWHGPVAKLVDNQAGRGCAKGVAKLKEL